MRVADEPLFPPQAHAVKRAIELMRCPVLGTMGSGKTRVALEAYDELSPWEQQTLPAMVLCNTNAMPAWIMQLQKWLQVPEDHIVIAQGKPKDRKAAWVSGAPFVLTTPAAFRNDHKTFIPKGVNLLADEYHRYMRTRTSTWEQLCTHLLKSKVKFLLSGTPMRKGPQDIWPAFHLCYRERFPGYWDFVKIWCVVIDNGFGQEIIGAKNWENFKTYAYAGQCAYMPKKETDKYLPEKTREFLPLDPSPFQRKLIQQVMDNMMVEMKEGGDLILTPSRITQIHRERQILVSPKLLDPEAEYGAGIDFLLDKLEEMEGDIPRPVIFTDFADAVPIIAAAIREKYGPDRNVYELRGGMDVHDLMATVKAFNASQDDALVCSLQYAESFEFYRSQVAYVLGFNWSRDQCEQAEDRLRRAISEYKNIRIYYLQHRNTIDGYVLSVVRRKGAEVDKVTPDHIIYAMGKIRL